MNLTHPDVLFKKTIRTPAGSNQTHPHSAFIETKTHPILVVVKPLAPLGGGGCGGVGRVERVVVMMEFGGGGSGGGWVMEMAAVVEVIITAAEPRWGSRSGRSK
ncbi:hypothetical protein Tco_1268458, partial [Tanacetum coccineum]